jgi:hypothetical protein
LMEGSRELAEGGDWEDESSECPTLICRSDREILADSSSQIEAGWGKETGVVDRPGEEGPNWSRNGNRRGHGHNYNDVGCWRSRAERAV